MSATRRWILVSALILCTTAFGGALADGVRLTDSPGAATDPYICSLGNGTGNLSVEWVDDRSGVNQILFTRID